jgi:hypothetical protein
MRLFEILSLLKAVFILYVVRDVVVGEKQGEISTAKK